MVIRLKMIGYVSPIARQTNFSRITMRSIILSKQLPLKILVRYMDATSEAVESLCAWKSHAAASRSTLVIVMHKENYPNEHSWLFANFAKRVHTPGTPAHVQSNSFAPDGLLNFLSIISPSNILHGESNVCDITWTHRVWIFIISKMKWIWWKQQRNYFLRVHLNMFYNICYSWRVITAVTWYR